MGCIIKHSVIHGEGVSGNFSSNNSNWKMFYNIEHVIINHKMPQCVFVSQEKQKLVLTAFFHSFM